MEIKQGDKVRVSKDAPKVYMSSVNNLFKYHVCKVEETDGNSAKIRYTDIGIDRWLAIPTKYLVKVDAEANVKLGSDKWVDKTVWNYKNHKKGVIRRMTDGVAEVFTEDGKLQTWQITDLVDEYDDPIEKWKYTEPTAPKIKVGDRVRNVNSDLCGIALKIEHGIVEVGIPYDKEKHYWNTDIVELVKPTEQTEAEKTDSDNFKKAAEEWANTVSKAIKEYGDAACNIIIDAHNEAYWGAYAADLAKEIVLKTVNSASDRRPSAIAEYATDVAKAVVERLKGK